MASPTPLFGALRESAQRLKGAVCWGGASLVMLPEAGRQGWPEQTDRGVGESGSTRSEARASRRGGRALRKRVWLSYSFAAGAAGGDAPVAPAPREPRFTARMAGV